MEFLEAKDIVEDTTLDHYTFERDAFLQHREHRLKDRDKLDDVEGEDDTYVSETE